MVPVYVVRIVLPVNVVFSVSDIPTQNHTKDVTTPKTFFFKKKITN